MMKWKCLCDDCGIDIRKAGEYILLNNWNTELGMKPDDNLCIGCVEKHLGRRITFADVLNMQNVGNGSDSGGMSMRLQVRIFGHLITAPTVSVLCPLSGQLRRLYEERACRHRRSS
jgi:hypothetical protein